MRELAGKVAIVTGAASGIGLAMARRFAAEEMAVVLADVEPAALDAAAAEVATTGAKVLSVVTDVSSADSVAALADEAFATFGAVHVLCNNAGVDRSGPSWDVPLPAWEWVLSVNLWGVIHGLHSFLPLMLEQSEGHVVNTASLGGLFASPFHAPYVATKFAVVGISESLHHELLGAPVNVSVLCPGLTRTNIIEADRNWPERLGAVPPPTGHAGAQLIDEFAKQGIAGGRDPAEVADCVIEGIQAERFWMLPDDHWDGILDTRHRELQTRTNPSLPAMG